ncbi:MAG: hypothetical protein ACJ706_04065 [Nitrososphaeraceae archaeon]
MGTKTIKFSAYLSPCLLGAAPNAIGDYAVNSSIFYVETLRIALAGLGVLLASFE